MIEAKNAFIGLTEVEVLESRRTSGPNVFTPPKRESLWSKFVAKFDDATIKLLLAAAIVSLLVAGWLVSTDGNFGHFIEGLGIMMAVGIATGVGLYNDVKSEKAFDSIKKLSEDILVKATRGGKFHTIQIGEVVVGDIVHLETGDRIPADGIVLRSNEFLVDQSSLTGESEAVKKREGSIDPNLTLINQEAGVCRGTTVRSGNAVMQVRDVGDKTEMGAIAQSLASAENLETPLQGRLGKLADLIGKVGMVSAVAIFVALVLMNLVIPGRFMHFDALVMSKLVDYFIIAVTIVVVAVPEGLPMMVTLSLALASRKLVKENCLVRSMDAAETIGCVTVICSDKTGTLTKNQMNIERFVSAQDEDFSELSKVFERHPLWPIAFAVNSTAELQGEKEVVGSSTEGAFLLALKEAGIDYRSIREAHPVVEREPFRSETKWMSTTVAIDVHHHYFLKGAPEKILSMCSLVETLDGVLPLSPELRARFEKGIRDAADEAMRTLAFARREPGTEENIFMGVAAIADPVREEIPAALDTCRKAGVSVKMVTGDNPATAAAIARRIGLLAEGDLVLTGEEFAAMSDEEITAKLNKIKVIARSRPADKKRLVELLQGSGETVAVTGDGTNDAPALKQADVGLSMGIAGTEVAKEASDLVLVDDNFATIVTGIKWGRTLYQNIQRFVQFQLTVNVTALAIALFGPFIGVELPLTAVQLLWVNIIMDTLAGIALGSEQPRDGVMNHTPIKRDASIVTPAMTTIIGLTSLFFFCALTWLLKFPQGENPLQQQTIFFTVFIFFQIWNELNARSLDLSSAFQQIMENRGFLSIMGLIVVTQVLLVSFGGQVFRTVPLGLSDWLRILVLTSSVLILGEGIRLVLRLFFQNKEKMEVPQQA